MFNDLEVDDDTSANTSTPKARLAHNTILREDSTHYWLAQQKVLDDEGNDEWVVDCVIDLTTERLSTDPLIELRRIGT